MQAALRWRISLRPHPVRRKRIFLQPHPVRRTRSIHRWRILPCPQAAKRTPKAAATAPVSRLQTSYNTLSYLPVHKLQTHVSPDSYRTSHSAFYIPLYTFCFSALLRSSLYCFLVLSGQKPVLCFLLFEKTEREVFPLSLLLFAAFRSIRLY